MSRSLVSLLLVLVASTSPSAVLFGPERAVPPPSFAPATRIEVAQAGASDGQNFLVIWNNGPLYASRVSDSGEVQVPPVLLSVGRPQEVSACWTGAVYLVTWSDPVVPGVMLASISRDGKLITAPHVIFPAKRTYAGGLAWNGKSALLVYSNPGDASVANAAMLDSGGSLLKADIALPTSTALTRSAIKAVSDGSNFALFWRVLTLNPMLETARIDSAGQLVDPGAVVLGTGDGDFDVAYGGGQYQLATTRTQSIYDPSAATLIRFTIDAATLQRSDLPPIDVRRSEAPAVAWNGSDFVTYWMRYDVNQFQLDIAVGNGPPATAFSGNVLGMKPLLVSNGGKFLVAWTDRSRAPAFQGAGDLFGAFLGLSGSAESAKFIIGYEPAPQFKPAIATSGTDSLIAWTDQMSDAGTGVLRATRVAADGSMLDNPPIDVGGSANVAVNKPAVVFAGDGYFVVWQEPMTNDIRGRRVDLSGHLGDVIDFGTGYGPAAAWNGSTVLVAFEQGPKILAVRIDARGNVLDSPPLLVTDSGAVRASVASNGSDFLVIWTEGWDYGPPPFNPNLFDVRGKFVRQSGAVDAAAINIATGPSDQSFGVVASDGRDYLVVYDLDDKLAAKTVTAEGMTSPGDGVIFGSILGDFLSDYSLSAASGGYALVWQNMTTHQLEFDKLDLSGAPIETAVLLQFAHGDYTYPSVATRGGIVEVVYDRPSLKDNFEQRVFFRLGGAGRGRAVRR